MGSLASTSQISQAETHVHVQLPPMLDMPYLPGTSQHDEEQQGLAPGALDVRGDLEQEIEDMLEGPAKEFLLHRKKAMKLAALAFLQPEEQPRSFMVVGLENEKIQSVKDFLEDMNDMLKAARESIRSAQDRAKTYANKACRKVTFEKGDFVFLKVPATSKTMKTGKCDKLSPRYCGPFKILKKLGDVAYKLELPESFQVHPVFHISRLKKSIHGLENVVSPDILVDLIEPPKISCEPKTILGYRDTRHKVYQEVLVKWTDVEEEATT
ncbi:hypothetical protein L7F22_064429 [Adiantum nelumboides]|nr:hypothetical protein [Adiantum nelumboides]